MSTWRSAAAVAVDASPGRRRRSQAVSSRPLPCACGASISQASSTASRRSKSCAVELELAGLDLGEVEDVVDDGQQRLARAARRSARTRAARRRARSSSSSSVMPITPFSGVRISWLMLARNSDFAREASTRLGERALALGDVGAHRADRVDRRRRRRLSGNLTSWNGAPPVATSRSNSAASPVRRTSRSVTRMRAAIVGREQLVVGAADARRRRPGPSRAATRR